MKFQFAHRSSTRQRPLQKGVVLMLMVIIIPILLIISGFAINLSYMELARTDLQVATDAATRAACRTYNSTGDISQAQTAAKKAATLNPVLGKVLTIRNQDILFGTSTRSSPTTKYSFTSSGSKINSVRVDFLSSVSGSIKLPMLFGTSNPNFDVAQRATATQSDVDIILVMDRSGSMAFAVDEAAVPLVTPKNAPLGWAFGDPVPPLARWLDAVSAVNEFLTAVQTGPQNAMIGLATYSEYANNDVALTSNYASITTALNNYSNAFNAGGTNIGDGIYTGLSNIQGSSNRRLQAVPVMILLTDGICNWGPNPNDAANATANANVIIYTITFSNEADQPAMQTIASIGRGKHFHATDIHTLKQAFADIANDLPVLLTE